jgi:hypothetical protein
MFDRASRKLGLEHAVLGTGSFSEAHQIERPSAEVLVELLKKGLFPCSYIKLAWIHLYMRIV